MECAILRPVGAGGAGGAMAPQILAHQLTLSEPAGADYAHHTTTGTPGFSDLHTGLVLKARGWNEPIVRPSDLLHQSPLSN